MAHTQPFLVSAHIIRAYQASGLTTQAFAEWLRTMADQVEAQGERALRAPERA